MLRGISTVNLWAEDLPFGNVLGIMHNRHYLDILGNRGGAQ
jgi:hypothetical protein